MKKRSLDKFEKYLIRVVRKAFNDTTISLDAVLILESVLYKYRKFILEKKK